jgi:hypothetical protein
MWNRCMKTHYQRGTIYEASGSFFVRYAANIDGVKQRVSHKLCDRDEEHYSTDCDKVLELRDALTQTEAATNHRDARHGILG